VYRKDSHRQINEVALHRRTFLVERIQMLSQNDIRVNDAIDRWLFMLMLKTVLYLRTVWKLVMKNMILVYFKWKTQLIFIHNVSDIFSLIPLYSERELLDVCSAVCQTISYFMVFNHSIHCVPI